jgi:mono/diheme cytochrome c family protein
MLFLIKLFGGLVAPVFFSSLLYAKDPAPLVPNPLLIEKGRKLYVANCLRCHNKDPNIKGSIGPEIVDAPYEVMYSKVMTGKYPDPLPKGFVPKRKSRAMQPLPRLKNDIPAIWAYVQSVKKKKK